MKTMKKVLAALYTVCCLVSMLALSAQPAEAAASLVPTASDNLNIGLRSTSELVATKDGYMRVFYDGEKIGIEYYDSNFIIQSKRSLDMELSVWGGFYAGSDAYYLVEGQYNTAEDDSAEVIRVIKYDTNWNKKGMAKITGNPGLLGGEVRYPFDHGCVEMTEYNGTLYIVTGHEGYVDPQYRQGHQGFLMIAVDEASMTGKIVASDLWHSFAQYIASNGSDLYVLEQSEGSRYTALSRYNAGTYARTSFSVLDYGGSSTSAWALSCYASVDGIALSSDSVLCLGTSIDQSKYDNVSSDRTIAHNIYLTVTPMSDFSESATTVKWLTNYSGDGKCFLGVKITKVNDNRFLITWEEYGSNQTASLDDPLSGSVLHYMFVDGKGNAVSKEFTAAAPISDCQPIVNGSKVVYCASSSNTVNFYSIDAQTGAFSKKVCRVAGENATWDVKDGVLTISGTGAVFVDTEDHFRYPLSSASGVYPYSSSDNAWTPIRENVTKLVISEGITSISERTFAYFSNLEEAELASGVKSIGKEAFYSCCALRKITIPASVTSIGEDILWTGYYRVSDESHVVYATIYAPDGSQAIKYATANNIRYKLDISEAKVSGISVSNTSDGVKVTWDELKGAENYRYRVLYKTDSGEWTEAGDTASTSYTWTGAKAGTTYSFTVRCIDDDGSYASDYDTKGVSIKYMLSTPKVTGASNAKDGNGIQITWDKVTGASKYRVFYKTDSGEWTEAGDTASTSYTWTEAKAGTTYSFTVCCINEDGSYASDYDTTGKSFTYVIDDESTNKNDITEQDGVEGFVERLYQLVLGRKADAAGKADWVNQLQTYTSTGAKVAEGFFMSDELANKDLSNEEYVRLCYRTLLNREADSAGLADWVSRLENGFSRKYVFKGFAESLEFQGICDVYGVDRGNVELTEPRDQNEGVTQFVARCYTKALGRGFDTDGLNDWCNRILTGQMTPHQVATEGFFHSQEFQNQGLDDTEYVKVLYRTFLGREYDEPGLEDWLGRLAGGADRDEIMAGFAGSTEFGNIMAQYGLT